MKFSWRRLIGLEAILLGLLTNKEALEQMLGANQTLTSWVGRSLIFSSQSLLVLAGTLAILPRGHRWRIKGLILVSSVVACGTVNTLLVQWLCNVPPIISGWASVGIAAGEVHQLGYRGKRIAYQAKDFVIVLLGDSQVEAKSGTMDEMPESRLATHLTRLGKRVKVFSLGAGGYGQDQELEAFKRYCHLYRADLVIVWETEPNDIWNNVFPTHWPRNSTPKPTYWLERGQLCGPTEALGQQLFENPIKLIALWERAATLKKLRTRDDDWEKRLPPPYKPERSHSGPVNRQWEELRSSGALFGEHLASEKSHLAIGFVPRSPRMEYGLNLTHSLLKSIETTAKSTGGKMIVLQSKVPPGDPITARDPSLVFRSYYSSNHPVPAAEVYLWNGQFYRASPEQAEVNWRDVNQGFETFIIPVTVADWAADNGRDSHLSPHANDQVMKDLAVHIAPLIPNTQ